MKRWIALGIVLLILIGGGCLLARTAVDPADYTGSWYGAEDGQLFFRHRCVQSVFHSAPHKTALALRVTWQLTFTATGSPATWVGMVSMFSPSAVVFPPKP